jgi:hypothetical protein
MINNSSLNLSCILLFICSQVFFAARSTKGITRLSPEPHGATERNAIKLPDEVKEIFI